MAKAKAPRNKTIDTSVEDGEKYLKRTICIAEPCADKSALLDKTIRGDTFEVLPLLPHGFVDLLIADPPYNLTKSFGGGKFSRLSEDDYEAYTRRWLTLSLPLLKPTASIYVCCDWQSSLIVGRVLDELLTLRSRITWQREKGRGAKANWKNSLEDVYFATLGKSYTFNLNAVKVRRRVLAPYRVNGAPKDWEETGEGNFRDTCPGNFWDDVTVPFWSMPENTSHPTQKPEKLVAKLICASSNEGDVVFDPFLGSGTTSVVAKKLNRRYVGIERDERYLIFAEERLERAEIDKTVQGYEDGVFYERNFSLPRSFIKAQKKALTAQKKISPKDKKKTSPDE